MKKQHIKPGFTLLLSLICGFLTLQSCQPENAKKQNSKRNHSIQTRPKKSQPAADLRQIDHGKWELEKSYAVEVQEKDVSLMTYARSFTLQEEITLLSIVDPKGQEIYHYDEESGELKSPYYTEPVFDNGEITILFPVHPRHQLIPGKYQFKFTTDTGLELAEVGALLRSGPVNSKQVLDVHLWLFVTAEELQDQKALSDMKTSILNEMNGMLAPHNLGIGQLVLHKGSPRMTKEYSQFRTNNDDGLGSELCRDIAQLSSSSRQLNVLVVDEILPTRSERKTGDGKLGITAALPGTLPTKEALWSCVIVGLDDDFDFANNGFGNTLLHEGGHLMGLAHTTEEDGQSFDDFEDTPQCPADSFDQNEDGIVDTEECATVDSRNFMFWEDGDARISAEQAWFLRRHPAFYPQS